MAVLKADGFDKAIIGTVQRPDIGSVLLYDAHKCISILVRDHGLEMDEAMDHFCFNVAGAYVGPETPCFAYLGPIEAMQ